jgi:hypothetical protein
VLAATVPVTATSRNTNANEAVVASIQQGAGPIVLIGADPARTLKSSQSKIESLASNG